MVHYNFGEHPSWDVAALIARRDHVQQTQWLPLELGKAEWIEVIEAKVLSLSFEVSRFLSAMFMTRRRSFIVRISSQVGVLTFTHEVESLTSNLELDGQIRADIRFRMSAHLWYSTTIAIRFLPASSAVNVDHFFAALTSVLTRVMKFLTVRGGFGFGMVSVCAIR
jgi:hypothetical protein